VAFVAFDEVLDAGGHISGPEIATPAQLLGDILGDVAGPALGRIEADDLRRAVILAGEQIGDDGFEVGRLVVGILPDPAEPTQIVHHEVDIMVINPRNDWNDALQELHKNRDSSGRSNIRSDSEAL
jgi:hypothetical protein